MNKVIFGIVLSVFVFGIGNFAQAQKKKQLKKVEVYASFEDMKAQRVSSIELQLLEKITKKGDKHYRLPKRKKVTLCYAVSNGENIYYKTADNNFVQLNDLGDQFYHFDKPEIMWVTTDGRLSDIPIPPLNGAVAPVHYTDPYFMNKETGVIAIMSKKNVRAALREKPSLLDAFEAEKRKGVKKRKKYLSKM
ncbi:MAG: hypothetical protein MK212_16590 [Saprospiraceae bacterium]|nr:hypothetical protein [Saprospiraceae bacterium]